MQYLTKTPFSQLKRSIVVCNSREQLEKSFVLGVRLKYLSLPILAWVLMSAANATENVPEYQFSSELVVNKIQRDTVQQRNGRNKVVANNVGNPLGHEGNTIVHASIDEYDNQGLPQHLPGRYVYGGDLDSPYRDAAKEMSRLVYSDGNGKYFLPHVTQEKWERDARQVRAFLASINDQSSLHLLPNTQIPGGRLAKGLYQLISIEEVEGNNAMRQESWARLVEGRPSQTVIIKSPVGRPAFAGMGYTAPFTLQFPNDVQEIQNRIVQIKSQINALERPENISGSCLVIGPTGSGKSTVVTALSGANLVAEETDDMGFILTAKNPPEGIHIGHGLNQAGTTIPGALYHPETNCVYYDCAGFGDPAEGRADIVNAMDLNICFWIP